MSGSKKNNNQKIAVYIKITWNFDTYLKLLSEKMVAVVLKIYIYKCNTYIHNSDKNKFSSCTET